MEYQQFINFLKAKHCYNEYLKILSSYQNPFLERYNNSIKALFYLNPATVIPNSMDWTSLRNDNKLQQEIWVIIHYKWCHYFYENE